ncbi:glycosyltransferase family 2 protein [soil metagenome]
MKKPENLKLAGVVVLYNPDHTVLDNIDTYINEVDLLYVMDNSEKINDLLISEIKAIDKVCYKSNQRNLGIASALNIASYSAITDGFQILLTMDQDSSFKKGDVKVLLDYYVELTKGLNIGIVCPYHGNKNIRTPRFRKKYRMVRTAMTSGNIVNLDAFKVAGGFNEELFLDYVDHEFCLRLRKNKFLIVLINSIVLNHNQGAISYHKLLGRKIYTTNHEAKRRYYITRNRLFVIKKYASFDFYFIMKDVKDLFAETIKILLYEKDKKNKIQQIFMGFSDFLKNKYGKLS